MLRSGINTVPKGQGEAARSLGMNFGQTLSTVVLPQAFRSVIPPVGSTLIALAKNSAIAGAFSVTELLGTYKTLNELGYSIIWSLHLDRRRLPDHHPDHQRGVQRDGEALGSRTMTKTLTRKASRASAPEATALYDIPDR